MASATEALLGAAMKYYTTLVDSTCDRWKDAAVEIEAGTYTTAKAMADLYSSWAQAGATLYTTAVGAIGPNIDFVYMKIAAGTIAPMSLPLPGTFAVQPTVTDLTEVAGANVLSAANGDVQIAPTAGGSAGAFDVIVTLPAMTPNGVYLGVAYGVASPVYLYIAVG